MWGTRTFYFGDRLAVGVRDLQRAIAWHQEKLKLRLTPFESEDYEALLSFDKDDSIPSYSRKRPRRHTRVRRKRDQRGSDPNRFGREPGLR